MSRADKANDITHTQTNTQQKNAAWIQGSALRCNLSKTQLVKAFLSAKKKQQNFSEDTKALCYTAIHVVRRNPSDQGTESETVHFNAAPPPLMIMSSSLPLLIHCPFSTCCQKKNYSKIPVYEKKKKPNSHSRMLIHNLRQNQNEWLFVFNSNSNCICLAQFCKSNLPQRDLYSAQNQHLLSSQPPTRCGETKNLRPKKGTFISKESCYEKRVRTASSCSGEREREGLVL